MPSCGARMSMRLSWSSAATFFSTSSAILPRISASSLPTSVRRSWSICRICSSVSVILPLVWAIDGDELAALAFEPRGVALERRHALDLDEVLAATARARPRAPGRSARSRASWPRSGRRGPSISSLSCAMRSLSCAFCPSRRRAAELEQALPRPSMTRATSGFDSRAAGVRRESRSRRRRRARPRAAPGARRSSSRLLITMRGWPGYACRRGGPRCRRP